MLSYLKEHALRRLQPLLVRARVAGAALAQEPRGGNFLAGIPAEAMSPAGRPGVSH